MILGTSFWCSRRINSYSRQESTCLPVECGCPRPDTSPETPRHLVSSDPQRCCSGDGFCSRARLARGAPNSLPGGRRPQSGAQSVRQSVGRSVGRSVRVLKGFPIQVQGATISRGHRATGRLWCAFSGFFGAQTCLG